MAGVVDITDTTDSSDATGDTGALRTEGGASIAKKLYVGTDLDVDGTTNLDVVDIDGAVDFASTTAHAGNATFADNAKALFGTGSDLEIYHDGSNSYVKDAGTGSLQLLGSSYVVIGSASGAGEMISAQSGAEVNLKFNNSNKLSTKATGVTVTGEMAATTMDLSSNAVIDGTLTVGGAAAKVAGKESIWVPAAAMQATASNGCSTLTTVETTSGRPDMVVLDFDKDSDEFAQFSIAFPKSWNEGTVTFQYFWSGLAATTGVTLGLQGVAVGDNDTIDVAYGTAVLVDDDAQGAVEEMLVSAESGAITIAGSPAVDQLCYFRVFRDVSASNDDMAGDCRLHGIKVFFTTDAANDA